MRRWSRPKPRAERNLRRAVDVELRRALEAVARCSAAAPATAGRSWFFDVTWPLLNSFLGALVAVMIGYYAIEPNLYKGWSTQKRLDAIDGYVSAAFDLLIAYDSMDRMLKDPKFMSLAAEDYTKYRLGARLDEEKIVNRADLHEQLIRLHIPGSASVRFVESINGCVINAVSRKFHETRLNANNPQKNKLTDSRTGNPTTIEDRTKTLRSLANDFLESEKRAHAPWGASADAMVGRRGSNEPADLCSPDSGG